MEGSEKPKIPVEGNIETSVNFKSDDLRDAIADRLERLYPSMPLEARLRVAGGAVNQIMEELPSPLYKGLILYGVRIAKDRISIEERSYE